LILPSQLAFQLLQTRQHRGDGRTQSRQLLLDDGPYLLEVDALVLVNQHVAEDGQRAPWHVRRTRSRAARHVALDFEIGITSTAR